MTSAPAFSELPAWHMYLIRGACSPARQARRKPISAAVFTTPG
ncbi:MAG TPA: hypothetical protein VGI58_09370 [Streptosporangiaceae bacterium]